MAAVVAAAAGNTDERHRRIADKDGRGRRRRQGKPSTRDEALARSGMPRRQQRDDNACDARKIKA
jgi:hypothetical protein